ncbi:MAG: alkaline phosphatase family protein [Phycisphaerae bacterium]|nr:alkaline phosphatase family protein [Gemmatimonadaceae bacterium]
MKTAPAPARRVLSASAALLVAGAFATPSLAAQTAAPVAAPRTRLVVQLTVDQLRGDYLDRYASQYTGGLKWLATHGAFFANATHDHAVTETAPGHATLWSGRHPSSTGIVRNADGVQDPQTPLLLDSKGGGASPFRFRGSALFDWIRSDNQWSQALSVSRKDRGAILPLGRAHQNVFWYGLDGNFTTSRYYADTMPGWVQRFNARDITKPYLTMPWVTLLPAAAYAEPDSQPAENQGRAFVFPHTLDPNPRKALEDFVEVPWMDEITVAFALNGVNELKLGLGNGTDVLAMSLSTTDAVGHRYGPDSRELHDQLLRLDRVLGKFLDSLFVLRDSSTIILALSSDHGVQPFPAIQFPGTDPQRGKVNIKPLMDSTRSRLIALGVESDVVDFESGMVVLQKARLRARGINVDSVVRSLQTAWSRLPGVQSVYRKEDLPRLAASGNVIARRWLHAIPENLDAVLGVSLKPYYYWSTVNYATHGTPNQLDAWVPIVFAGAPFKAGRYKTEVHTVDIAPTLAAALGISPSEAVDGNVLREALRTPPPVGRSPQRR